MSKPDYSWTCPYCRQVATIKPDNVSSYLHTFERNNKLGLLGLYTYATVCPNSKCRDFTIIASLYNAQHTTNGVRVVGEPIIRWDLKPQSSAKPFPDYIPPPIRQDYEEACLICSLSPKASATLSRRCLQGIIRDYWGITKARLVDEIAELKDKIDSTTWQAIDAVRSIGNIGAHMEKDINLIVDVEPQEADLLIRLIEVLLEEWYIRRHERDEHMQKVIAAAQGKASAKNGDNH
ncbi:DUF4145 domain-containing protein [Methylomonas sp. EFPC3]|uniref:DUF4145 domain-containing protein n=1 Tax=Methylomonas sp. EFPC3 TaxID=3021710 RepID=UPI002417ECC7|nr:DUF4145 domain-containing protein [Methylomonas sp. EFPC3]WFP50589.1 DUF4145 domain-containing protein [Methylomonas sp. EFPC3]